MRDATPSETDETRSLRRNGIMPAWFRHVFAVLICSLVFFAALFAFDHFILHALEEHSASGTAAIILIWVDELLAVGLATAAYAIWQKQKSLGRKASLMDALLDRKPEIINPGASLELVCDSAIYINEDGFIEEVSESSSEFFGYRPEDMLGRKSHELIKSSETDAQRRANWSILNEDKQPLSFEGPRAGADGKERLMGVTAFPVLNVLGNIEGIWLLYRSISDTDALENQRRLQEAVWDQLDEVIVINDLTGKVLSVNHAAEKFFGRLREELEGAPIRNLVKDIVNYNPFHQRILKGLEEAGQWREIFEVQWASGRRTWASFVVKPLTNSQGRIVGHINTFIDVSEQQRAELQRSLSERRYRMLFESSSDGIVIGRRKAPGQEPELLEANDTYLAMVGYTMEEHKKLSYQATTPDEWRAYEREKILPIAKAEGVTPPFEKELLTKDGRRLPVSCRYWRIDDPDTGERLVIGFYRDISEQKAATASQERQAIALEQAQDVVIIQEVSGRILEINSAAEQLFGLSQGSLGKMYRAELLHADFDREQFSHDWAQAMQESGAWSGDLEVTAADGSMRIVDASSTALRDRLDRIIAVVDVYRDVTESRRVQESLRLYKQVWNQLGDAVRVVDLDGNPIETNPAAAEIFGNAPTPDSPHAEIKMAERGAGATVRNEIAAAVEAHGEWIGQFDIKRDDGEVRTLEQRSVPFRGENGDVIGRIGLSRDVTERRRADERLRLYAQVWEQVRDGVSVVDLEGNVLEANPAAHEIFGINSKPDDPSAYSRLADPEAAKKLKAELVQSVAETGEWFGEFEIRTDDGELRTVEQRAVAFRDEDGKIIGRIGLNRDVTERRRTEERLRLYEQVWNQVRDGVSVVDLDGNLMEANPAAMETFGTAQTPAGQDAYRWVADGVDARALKEEVASSVRETGQWLGEFDILTEDGVARRIEQRSVAFRNEDGEIVGRIGLTRDITEKRATDQRLRLFEAVWNQVSEAVTLVDNDGQIIDLNPAAERMLERAKDELVGSDSYKRVRQEDRTAPLQTEIKDSVAETGRWAGEMRVHNEAGVERVLDHSVVPLRDETGDIIGRIGVSRDVTQDRETRDLLDRQSVALEQVADPIFMTDVDGKVYFCNAAAERLLGKSREQIYELKPFELYSTIDSYEKQLEERARQIQEKGVFTGTYQFMRRDGTRWVEFSKTPIRNETSQITGFIAVHRDQTEQREAAQVLERQAAALDQVREAVFMTDLEGQIIYANETALALTGNTIDQLKAYGPEQLYDGEFGYDDHLEKREEAIEADGVFEAEYEHDGPNGAMVIEYSSSPIRNAKGETIGYISVNRDITLRREAEQALMRQAIVMDQIGDAVTVFDLNGYIVDCNLKTPELFHMSREDLIGQPSDFAAIDKETFAKQRVEWRTAVLGGSTWTGEIAMRASTGREFTLETTVAPLTNSGGELTHFTAVSRDVTERKRQEEQRLQHETIWQQMGDAILLVGLDEQILDCNPSAEALTGFTSNQLLSMKLSGLDPDPETNTERRKHRFAEAAADGRWQGKGEILTKNDDRRIIDAVVVPLSREDGAVVSNILVFRDITDRQATEAQLRQAQKMEAVGRLTGGIAHDFNNLLAVIIGNLELGVDYYDQIEDLRTASKKALTAAHKGAALTQQLLDYARTREHTPVVTELNAMIASMIDLLKGSVGDPVELDLQLAEVPCYVSVDPNQLENAIINMAINARDAMPGGGTLTLRTTAPPASSKKKGKSKNRNVTLEIIDSGTGIPDEVMSQIFDPFFTTKDVGKGSGLGLSMVFSFVQQAGGFISVKSTQGEGTTFQLSFPECDVVDVESDDVASNPAHIDAGGLALLLVEDDPTVRAVTSAQLEQMGFVVTEAVDAADAIRASDDMEQCDVLVTDIGLPGGTTGIDLANQLLAQNPELPILLMTGYAEDEVMNALPDEAHFNVIQKPFQKTTLAKTLKLTLALD